MNPKRPFIRLIVPIYETIAKELNMFLEFIIGYYAYKVFFSRCVTDAELWQNIFFIREHLNDDAIIELENTYRSIPFGERNAIARNMKTLRGDLKSVRKLARDKKLKKEIDDVIDKCRTIESICNRWF